MNKHLKSGICLLLLCALLSALVFPVLAAEEPPLLIAPAPAEKTLQIDSEEDFLAFAENCLLDTYSNDMLVSLNRDLNLEGLEFPGISIFSGIFEGNNHTISGIAITNEGSVQGLFRYLTETAVVRNLTVSGSVLPEGSRKTVGGIAGSNAGRMENCVFNGEVSGSDFVGGIAGANQVAGILENCRVSGSIHGNHFVGGVAGQNFGLIRSCSNEARINETANQNQVKPSEISADTIIGTESADTVTDVGGIAGTSSGVIRKCENHGTVGYPHMGYNIGGIAGSQRGYITECQNVAEIYGRKEIAGIVGQMEPVSKIAYTEDTLQILRQQLANTSALANQASSNVHSSAESLSSQMSSLRDSAETAIDAVNQLIPSAENPHLPDFDSILAAKNTLSSSMNAMQNTMSSINSTASATVSTASSDIRAITGQISAISNTLDNAAENLGGTVYDVSDSDTEEDLNGKVSLCENFGSIAGDLNIGGIVGSVAWENDLDPESDYQIVGNQSLNFQRELRAVILNCRNHAEITGKKKNIGGIAGNLSLGLIRSCTNTGSIQAENAENLGGIVGISAGYVRSCSAKCQISGRNVIGGIAGKAPVVSDCLSMTEIQNGREQLGSVIGMFSESTPVAENPIFGNYYLPGDKVLGAIDGINYSNVADSLSMEAFLNLEDLPELFRQATVTFLFPDGSSEKITVPLGESMEESQIPAVPERDGSVAQWNYPESFTLENIRFDTILEPVYTPCRSVIQSENLRGDGTPVMLAEGMFGKEAVLHLDQSDAVPELSKNETLVESWKIPHIASGTPEKLRLSIPESAGKEKPVVYLLHSDGTWSEAEVQRNASYLVFSVSSDDDAICLVTTPSHEYLRYLIPGCAVLLLLAVGISLVLLKKKHKKASRRKK